MRNDSQAKARGLLRGAVMALMLLPLMVLAGPGNIAPEATVTASSELSPQFAAAHVADGVIGVDSSGEWACEGQTTDWGYIRFPWVQLTWKEARWINKVVLYDRPSAAEHVAGGRLVFSDGSRLYVDQIPNDGTGKAVSFPARQVSWVKWEVTDGTGKDLGLSELEVYPAPASYTDYVSWVDPYIETNRGRYFFFVTGGRPFGMVGAAPHTRNKNQNGGGYNYNEQNILGFGQIHDWMISGLEVMPTPAAVDPRGGEEAWKSAFRHDDEIVQPGYQRVYLQSHHVWTELTATDRVAFYRFTWTKTMPAQVLVNLGGYLANSTMEDAVVSRTGPAELSGSFSSAKRYWGGPRDVRVFFVVQFDRPFDRLDGWKGQQLSQGIDSIRGDNAGVSGRYNVQAGDRVQMKVAISFTSIENARVNLEKECAGWDFSAVKKASQHEWNDWLGKIAVSGGSEAQKAKFYTDLWHVLLGRHKINDINGYYPDRTTGRREGNFTDAIFKIRQLPLKADGTPKFNMYNSDAFWLSQWNLNVLWGLGWPEVQDEMSASLLQYADNGYLLPRGPSGGGYSYIMTSCPAVSLVVSTYMKGLLTKADPKHAFKLIRQNLMPGGMLGAADDIRFYTRHGWWPGNAGITIEAAFQDWGAAQMAKKLGLQKDYRYFMRRSAGWQTCFDTSVGLLMPRGADGKFFQQDPLSGKGWVEANAWQGSWGVSHDLPKLAS